VVFELVRAGRTESRTVEVPLGTPVRRALRSIGQAPEGSAVLEGEEPVPLDRPIRSASRFTVLSTFSGG
jgi:sulfur carrier protein ThiS